MPYAGATEQDLAETVKHVEGNALLFLVSDEGRYITGVTLPVDAGMTQK